jgi:hypothetical protein
MSIQGQPRVETRAQLDSGDRFAVNQCAGSETRAQRLPCFAQLDSGDRFAVIQCAGSETRAQRFWRPLRGQSTCGVGDPRTAPDSQLASITHRG